MKLLLEGRARSWAQEWTGCRQVSEVGVSTDGIRVDWDVSMAVHGR